MMAGRKIWTLGGLRTAFPGHPLWGIEQRYPHIDSHPQRRDDLLAMLFEWGAVAIAQRREHLPTGFVSRTADYAAIQRMVNELGKVEVGAMTERVGEKMAELEEVQYVDGAQHRFYRPQTIVELFELKRQVSGARVVASGVEMCRKAGRVESGPAVVLSVEGIGELRALVDEGSHWEIGGAVALAQLVEMVGDEFPGLLRILEGFESGPIRNRATLGGQLNTDLGRAELGPILLALGARVRLASAEGARDLTLDSFYGKKEGSALRQNEIIAGVSLPRNTPEMLRAKGCERRLCDGYKVASRRSFCPGLITAGFAVELDGEGKVTQSVLAYGGLGERPLLAVASAAALKGKPWNQTTLTGVVRQLDEEVATLAALDTGDIRRPLVVTLFQKFFHQNAS
jgi:xanthine dehydrogenase iron-sulfur cluster and FAD-binding subunit A